MFRKKTSSPFLKNVITMMTGTGIAQAIPIGLSPLLTRIYTPDEFGLFALYSGIAAVLAVVATGRYELAIMLPEKDKDAVSIVVGSSLIAILIGFLVLATVLIFGRELVEILGNEDLYPWLFVLPISIVVTGMYQSLNYWFNRKRDFKRLASNRVMQSAITGGGQTALGFAPLGGIGLLIGSLMGQLVTLLTLINKIGKYDLFSLQEIQFKSLKKMAKRYRSFPAFDVPTSLLNVGAMHAPNILFPMYFTSAFAGFYYLMQRVLQAPISLVATSVLDVFKEEASKQYRLTGEAKVIFIKTLKWLMLLSLGPSFVLYFVIEDLFVFVFGKDWALAGTFAKYMIPALSVRLIVNPLSFMIYIAEKQIWNLATMIALASGVFMSFFFATEPLEVIQGISFTYVMYYLTHLLVSARFARAI
jgi:O-antigen/teichoic acid export membrane protein